MAGALNQRTPVSDGKLGIKPGPEKIADFRKIY
jgi:hypothetical protein